MAEAARGPEGVLCGLCVDLLKEPTTLPCGHSFCMDCIERNWDERTSSSCPKCGQTFSPRPVLSKNTVLAQIMTRLRAPPADDCEDQHRDSPESAARQKTPPHTRLQDVPHKEAELQRLRREAEDITSSAQRAVQRCRDMFTQTSVLLEKHCSEVEQQIHSEQETQLRRVQELQDRLQRDGTELTEEVSALSLTQSQTGPRMVFEDFSRAVLSLGEKLQATLREFKLSSPDQDQTKASLTQEKTQDQAQPTDSPSPVKDSKSEPEPCSRADLLRYFRIITMDKNTANWWLHVTSGSRKVLSLTSPYPQPDHPHRFKHLRQVLGSEGLTGRCYFELEWCMWPYGGVDLALSYRDIGRDDWGDDCLFGHNHKSWVFRCEVSGYSFMFNKVRSPVPGPVGNRLGVYLDHDAGVLSFHRVQGQDSRLLHRVQTRFSRPLHVGGHFWGHNAHVLFLDPALKESVMQSCSVS